MCFCVLFGLKNNIDLGLGKPLRKILSRLIPDKILMLSVDVYILMYGKIHTYVTHEHDLTLCVCSSPNDTRNFKFPSPHNTFHMNTELFLLLHGMLTTFFPCHCQGVYINKGLFLFCFVSPQIKFRFHSSSGDRRMVWLSLASAAKLDYILTDTIKYCHQIFSSCS